MENLVYAELKVYMLMAEDIGLTATYTGRGVVFSDGVTSKLVPPVRSLMNAFFSQVELQDFNLGEIDLAALDAAGVA